MPRSTVRVRPAAVAALRAGRPWVYRGEVLHVAGSPATGDVVLVADARDRPLGQAFYHDRSLLAVRMLTRDAAVPVDAAFFRARLARAVDYRRRLYPDGQACRLVFAEADGLPGLIADRLGDTLVIQVSVAGIERRLDAICDDLVALTGLRHVFERNDASVRRLEGLPQRVGALRGAPAERAVVREGRVHMDVDLPRGSKTGHFLDQRDNRVLFGELVAALLVPEGASGRAASSATAPVIDRGDLAYGSDGSGGRAVEVLDAFCHSGGFGLQALAAGAAAAVFVDSAPEALETVRRNLAANGFGGGTVVQANAFDAMRALEHEGRRFDAVVVDPPAFARSRAQLDGAYRGYKDINLRAMRLLRAGGLLCTSSCSQPVAEAMFGDMLRDAAADAGRRMRVVARRGAGPDHPGLLGADETSYLKCWFLQAVD